MEHGGLIRYGDNGVLGAFEKKLSRLYASLKARY
jgi:hypothetical protein